MLKEQANSTLNHTGSIVPFVNFLNIYFSVGEIDRANLIDWSQTMLKGLCHPTRMREPMKTNLKKSARLFQVLSEILEGCFYLSKSQPSFDS